MKYIALFIGFLVLLSPSLAFAQTLPTCSAKGYTAVFVNGIFDSEPQAEQDKNKLIFDFNKQTGGKINNQPVTFQLGYNPTHLGGGGDLAQAFAQQFNSSLSDFDLKTILMQIYPEVTTRKLLVVGHSQGAEYANEIYSYLLDHGEPKEAVGVYAVGTPASYVAGGGKYITSTNDSVIDKIIIGVTVALQDGLHPVMPLPPNVTLDLSAADRASNAVGHSFTESYLANAAPRIVSDISGELSTLVPTDASDISDCFTPPDNSLGYKTQQVLFAVGDPTAIVLKVGAVTTWQVGTVALKTATTFAVGAIQMIADTLALSFNRPSDAQATTKTNTVVSKLYGSSLDGLSEQDKKDLLGSAQGGAVALALAPKAPEPTGVVLGTSTELAVDVSADTAPTSTPSTTPGLFPQSSNGPVWGGGGSPTPQVAATVADDSAAVASDDSASSTPDLDDEASSTPPAPALPTGAPVVDNFDSYSADPALSAWTVVHSPYNANKLFGADDGSGDTYGDTRVASTSDDCHAGGCIIATGREGGLGGGGSTSFMYKESGVAQDSGAFTIWARTRHGWRDAAASVGLCAGVSLGCENVNNYWFDPLGTNDNVWHRYYLAWRQGSTTVETCLLQDDTLAADCSWRPTLFAAGTQFDGIFLAGGVLRPDLGDQVWFDDLENAPQ